MANVVESGARRTGGQVAAVRRGRRRGRWIGLWFALPSVLLVGVFMLIPVLYGLSLSFTEYSPLSRDGAEFIGFDNYAALLNDEKFFQSLGVTLRYTIQVLPIVVVLALGLAVLANRPMPGIGFFRSALYVPHIVSLTAVSMIWLWIYSQNGLVNEILSLLGLQSQRWLYEPDSALNAVVAMRVWKALGSNMVLLLAGLQGIPKHLYEAARMDGAGTWQQFWHITLPGLRPMLTFVVTMNVIYLSQSFAEIFVLTGGGPLGATTTVNYLIYQSAFQYNQMGTASAMAVVLFALIAGLSYLSIRSLMERK